MQLLNVQCKHAPENLPVNLNSFFFPFTTFVIDVDEAACYYHGSIIFRVNGKCNCIPIKCNINFYFFSSSFNSTELFSLQVLWQMLNKLLGDAQKPLWFFIVIHPVWFWVLFIYLYFMLETMADNLRSRHRRIKLHGVLVGFSPFLLSICLHLYPRLPPLPICPIHQMKVISQGAHGEAPLYVG